MPALTSNYHLRGGSAGGGMCPNGDLCTLLRGCIIIELSYSLRFAMYHMMICLRFDQG
jgi:hypothetical protein